MLRRILLLVLLGSTRLLSSGQNVSITLTSEPVLSSGKSLTARLALTPGKNSSINSIIFRNGIIDTFYRYLATKLIARPPTLILGTPPSPGLYFLEIDTVSNMVTGGRPEGLDSMYSVFVHPENVDGCACDNSMNTYPVRSVTRSSFPAADWISLDSLVSRVNPDTLSNRIDTMMLLKYANTKCDTTTQPPTWQMAFILTMDEVNNRSNLSIVLDPLGSAPLNTAGMITACIGKFEYFLLDLSSKAPDTTTISADTRQKLMKRLDTLKGDKSHSSFDVYRSNGFVRQVFELNKQMDINHVCEKYCLYRRKDIVGQLVFVMKIPPE